MLTAALAAGILFVLILLKVIRINIFFAGRYELRGVDVSHYQGDVDWEILEGQEISFAFIKATEGSGYVDAYFYDNWQGADRTQLFTGAYHFFSFDSPASTQAENYISTVGDLSGKIAPVVDVEYYGDKRSNPPDRERTVAQLQELLALLEAHYHAKPIIYTTCQVYQRYIKGEFGEYPLWIRNVYYPPDVDMKGEWVFWQYSDKGVLRGYSGDEKYIDLNVFNGSLEDLEKYMVP